MGLKTARLNHTAAALMLIGTIIVLIGTFVRFRSTSLELRRSNR